MKRRYWLRSACGALVFAALSACSTRVAYEGARLAPSEEAVLVGMGIPETRGRTSISVVDGHRYVGAGIGEGATRVFVKPGRHSVTVVHLSYPYGAQAALWFEAVPGRRYLARAGRREGVLAIWIEDSMTGQMVGGIDENPMPLISDFSKDRP